MNFEDMIWLFQSRQSSRGIVRLNLAEAALLWRMAARAKTGMVEIGRRHGGSTCLLSASNPTIPLVSIDVAPAHDARCEAFLSGRDDNLTLVTGDSKICQHDKTYDFAFIDGDHSYEGVKADWLSIAPHLANDAVILFHDAVKGAYGACEGVTKLLQELIAEGSVEVIEEADSMAACRVKRTSNRKLTIGMLTFDDFHGVYFTIQSLQLHHPEIADDIEFLILDNNPSSAHGEAVRRFTDWVKCCPIRYIPITDTTGTALRDRIFRLACTPYVLCIDGHVLFESRSIKRLIQFMEEGHDEGSLLQGPMLYDNMGVGATHMDPVWRDAMWGTWGIDPKGTDRKAEPFEIPAHGMGVFACRKDSWLGFNPAFRGFGGEECYIHEKYRQAGRKTICLPFLRWLHRFPRPDGVPYTLNLKDRIRNYLIGHQELKMDTLPVIQHFLTMTSKEIVMQVIDELESEGLA